MSPLFTYAAKHSRLDDIEMTDKNEWQDSPAQETTHHGWCHNEK